MLDYITTTTRDAGMKSGRGTVCRGASATILRRTAPLKRNLVAGSAVYRADSVRAALEAHA
ncbi:hypothetical protein [Bradyrhizobium sp. HKCCYLR20261]|uniref:hypothetical protein n=1 Tax=unclassified Bradyrhizobium TaxID=2631580 RepID=UPI003EC00D9F